MKRASIVLVVAAAVALALGVWQDAATEAKGPPTVALPDNAAEVAPNVFSLGAAMRDGRAVEGLLFVRRTGVAHPAKGGIPGPPAGGGDDDEPPPPPAVADDPAGDASCFSFIDAAGANWPGAEPYVFSGSGSGVGVTVADMNAALVAWDSEVGAAVFGVGASGSGLDVALDDSNEVFFARLVGPGANNVIAATWVWYVPGADFVEWDMVFNTRFDWSLNPGVVAGEPGDGGAMDFLNIAVHEGGHAAGMGHTVNTDLCSGETMFPTGSNGETLKRTLAAGDVAGINALYPGP
jgi:hypothetical protein